MASPRADTFQSLTDAPLESGSYPAMDDERELADRILAELDERGADNLHSILNTVIEPTGSPHEIDGLGLALADMLRQKEAHLALETMYPRKTSRLGEADAEAMLAALHRWFKYDASQRYWMLGNGDPLKDEYPILVLSDIGQLRAQRLLEMRGYRWWTRSRVEPRQET